MARQNKPDDENVLSLLDDVYGDELTARESTIEVAVRDIEAKGFRAYDALQRLQRDGKVPTRKAAPVIEPKKAVGPAAKVVITAEKPAVTAISDEIDLLAEDIDFDLIDSMQEEPVVLSGAGADFSDPGRTFTHIVIPPKRPPGR